MTKRIKLLSVMVAAVLCFTAGLAILFGSNNTAKADAEYTKYNIAFAGTTGGAGRFHNAQPAGEGATTITFEWKTNASTKYSSTGGYQGLNFFSTADASKADADATNYCWNHHSDDWWQYNGVGAGHLLGEKIFATAGSTVKVVFNIGATKGMDCDDAYSIYHNGTIMNLGGENTADWGDGDAANAVYYGIGARVASNIYVDDLVCYDDLGNDLGIKVANEIPAVVDSSAVASHGDYRTASGFSMVNTTATTSRWVYFEFDNSAESSAAMPSGVSCRWYQSVQDKDAAVYVGNGSFTNGIARQVNNSGHTITAFNNDTGADVHTIIAFDTTTGTSYVKKDNGSWATLENFGGSGIKGDFPNTATAWYAGFCANSYNGSVKIKNLKCYDVTATDLGVTTTGLQELVDITFNTTGIGVVENFQRWNVSYTTTKPNGDAIDYTFSIPTGSIIKVNGKDYAIKASISCAYQGLLLVGSNAFGCEKVADVPGMHVVIPAALTGCVNDIEFYINGLSNGTTVAPVEGVVKGGEFTLGAQGGSNMRWIGDVAFVDAETGADLPALFMGNVAAKKRGTEDVTLRFTHAGGATQLFYLEYNHTEVAWTMNDWYLIEAGTMIGKEVVLAEDCIVAITGTTFKWFPADKQFNVSYTGAEAGANATTYSYAQGSVALTAPADTSNMLNGAWYNGSNVVANLNEVVFVGDVTLNAQYAVGVELKSYSLSIGSNLALTVDARNVGSVGLTAVFTTVVDGETTITKTVGMHHYANEVPGKIILVDFTFDGILPQHLGDNVNVKIMYGEIALAELDVVVADYLEAKVEAAGADAALAQDVLYYGAAAQLYTNHDVENVVADLSAAAPVEIPAEASVYAKAGEKDANYYWYDAKVVYDNTVKLVLTIVAPADSNITVAYGADEIAATVNEAGLYEVAFAVPAHAFGTSADLTIKVDGEAVGQVLTYSVNSYIVNAPATDADYATLLERLYCLGVSAAAYANA